MSGSEGRLQKYFIALIPPSPYYEEAWMLKHFFKDNFYSEAALRSPPHITLHRPFTWQEKNETRLFEVLTHFAARQTPFDVEVKGFGAFAPRVIYLQVVHGEALQRLAAGLQQICAEQLHVVDTENEGRPFHPHLTVAFRDLKKSDFFNAWNAVKEKHWEARWQVEAITLLKHTGKLWLPHRDFSF